MSFSTAFSQQRPGWIFARATAAVMLLGLVDHLTGYEISLWLLYGAPIFVVAWNCDKKSALLIALMCGLVWWWANFTSNETSLRSWHEAWETFVRLGFFIFMAIGSSALRSDNDAAKARIALLEENHRLEQEIIHISEREQQRIGQDLHDSICQHLAALGYVATTLEEDLKRRNLTDEARSAGELAEQLQKAVVQTRDAARGLYPLHLEDTGLGSALEGLALSATRLYGINCTFESAGSVPDHDKRAAIHLYRIAQEAVSNAFNHGQAQNIALTLNHDAESTILRIADDGVGISEQPANRSGMGLRIMKYRARVSGGRLQIQSGKNQGTIVRCSILPNSLISDASPA